jgi:guanylate kinase
MSAKIAIVGPAATGKDYLRKRMMDRGFVYGVSCTTRLPREGEAHGKDYYYLTPEEFESKIERGEFAEWQDFNGWKYGLTKDEFEKCDVMILNAEAVNLLEPEYRNKLFIIYLDIAEETRRERLGVRADKNDEIDRRIMADNDQFRNFFDFDCRITNENF